MGSAVRVVTLYGFAMCNLMAANKESSNTSNTHTSSDILSFGALSVIDTTFSLSFKSSV